MPIVYPGDADGIYKPVSEHGIVAPLDDFLGCHDLSSFPDLGSSARPAASRRRCGRSTSGRACRTRRTRSWAYDQPNVDFWHSATFSWDGKVANFIDESFGDGCPTTTTKTGGVRPGRRCGRRATCTSSRRESGDLLSEFRNPRPTNDDIEPDDRQVLLLAPRHPGAGEGPLPAGQRVLPRRLLGDRLHRPDGAGGDRVRRPGRDEHVVRVHLPAPVGEASTHPGLLERRPEPQLRHGRGSRDYPEAAYGFQRFRAEIGRRPGRPRPPQPAVAGAGDPDATSVRSKRATASRGSTTRATTPLRARATTRRARSTSSSTVAIPTAKTGDHPRLGGGAPPL